MAYTPAQLKAISGQLGETYADGEKRILRILAQGNITDWKRAFLQQQLAQIRAILQQLNVETAGWAQMHIPGLYTEGMREAQRFLPGGMDLHMTKLHQTAVQLVGENLATKLGDATSMVGRRVDDVFRQVQLKSLQDTLVGGGTGRDVSRRIVGDLQQGGLTVFTDKAGRQWDLQTYAEMCARTTAREATSQGTRNSVLEAGYDLVQISNHGGSCELCAPWEDEVVSLTGATPGYPTIDEAEAAGYGHPNCAHVETPYITEEQVEDPNSV